MKLYRCEIFIKRVIQIGIFFILVYSSSSFQLFGLGFGSYMNLGYAPLSSSDAAADLVKVNIGVSVGILTPYLADAIFDIGVGVMDGRSALFTQATMHYTYMFHRYFGFNVGFGLGLDMPYGIPLSSTRQKFNEASYMGLVVRSHIPVGFKFFPMDALECFVLMTTDIGSLYGWSKKYLSVERDPDLISKFEMNNRFYWGIGARIGIRYWY